MAKARYVGNKHSTKIVGGQDTAWIISDKIVQFDEKGKIQNKRANDRLILVVGANGHKDDGSHRQINEINPAISAAGIIINQAVQTSYVLNPDRKEDGIILPQPVTKNGDKLIKTEKGTSNVTIFAEDHRYVAFGRGGINLHTGFPRQPDFTAGSGVSLIHGKNGAKDLEPMVKGKALATALDYITDSITTTNSNVYAITNLIMKLSSVFGMHTHIVPQIPVGITLSAPSILATIEAATAVPLGLKSQVDNVIGEINDVFKNWNRNIAVKDKSSFQSEHHKLN